MGKSPKVVVMRYCKDCSYFGEEVEGVFEPTVHLCTRVEPHKSNDEVLPMDKCSCFKPRNITIKVSNKTSLKTKPNQPPKEPKKPTKFFRNL